MQKIEIKANAALWQILPKASYITESYRVEYNSPQPPQQVTCHQPPAMQGIWMEGQINEVSIFSNHIMHSKTNFHLSSLKTYVSVLTVSSLRPTIGRSMSSS